jgi:5-methylcytosine-specific restriction endonuclease McrA
MQLELSYPEPVGKKCSQCKKLKPAAAFSRSSYSRSGLQSACRACMKIRQDRWWAANREKYTAMRRANPEPHRERCRAWKAKNLEYERERGRRYVREHVKERSEYGKRYLASLPPEVKKVQWAAIRYRRTMQAAAAGPPPSTAELAKLYGDPCAYCGGKSVSIDHIHPISRGGTNSILNLVGCCHSCNSSKSNKLLLEWWREERVQAGLDRSFKVRMVFLGQLSELSGRIEGHAAYMSVSQVLAGQASMT